MRNKVVVVVSAILLALAVGLLVGLSVRGSRPVAGPEGAPLGNPQNRELNVKEFGALGNGTADDCSAFTAAVAELPANGGAIFIPPGTYKLGCTWVLNKTVRVRGAGAGTEAGDAAVSRLLFSPGVTGISVERFWSRLSDLFVESESRRPGEDDGIRFRGASRSQIENVFVKGFGRDGFNFDSSGPVQNNHIVASNLRSFINKRYGYYVSGGRDINVITFIGCVATANDGYGFYEDGAKNTYINSGATFNGTYDYFIDGSSALFLNPYSEGEGTAHFAGNWNTWIQPGIYGKSRVEFSSPAAQTANLVMQDMGWRGPSGIRLVDYAGIESGLWRLSSAARGQIAFRDLGPNGTAGTGDVWRVLTADGDLRISNRDLSVETAGRGLKIREGSDAKMGTATLSGGRATVRTDAVTAQSRIFLTVQTARGTVGSPYVSARTGTSFTITSTSSADSSTVAWLIVEPA